METCTCSTADHGPQARWSVDCTWNKIALRFTASFCFLMPKSIAQKISMFTHCHFPNTIVEVLPRAQGLCNSLYYICSSVWFCTEKELWVLRWEEHVGFTLNFLPYDASSGAWSGVSCSGNKRHRIYHCFQI